MSFTQQVRLVALSLIAVAVFAPAPAFAGKIKLTPTGLEPDASGQATLETPHKYYGRWIPMDVSVSCRGLEPGQTYYCQARTGLSFWEWQFTTDETGAGEAGGAIFVEVYVPFTIRVVNADGEAVLIWYW